MTVQADQLFSDVHAIRGEDDFLMEPRLVEKTRLVAQTFCALAQPLLCGLDDPTRTLLQSDDQLRNRAESPRELAPGSLPLGATHGERSG